MTEFARRFNRNWRDFKPSLAFELIMFNDSGWFLVLFGLYIPLPFLDRYTGNGDSDWGMRQWGASYKERSLYVKWDKWSKFIYMPWSYEHVRWQVMTPEGTFVNKVNSWDPGEPDGRWIGTFPYQYQLKNGEVQNRTATIYVERGEWRQKWLMWCPWFAMVRQSIDVHFDDEVGERSGSWKGGVIGTGYTMKKGETPEQTLRRMEREHKFN